MSDPKFSFQTRVRVAVAKFYGLDGQEWSKDEIAEFLNVSPDTVDTYLHETDMGQNAEHSLVEKEAQTRLQLIQQLQDKLEKLENMEDKVSQEKEIVPTQYRLKQDVEGEIDFDDVPHVQNPDGGSTKVEVDVPVPHRFEEMPNLDKLESIWREKRLVQEQLEDLLGLESPDELDVQEEKVVDVKYWRTDDSLPEQEVIDIDSPDIDGELPEAE